MKYIKHKKYILFSYVKLRMRKLYFRKKLKNQTNHTKHKNDKTTQRFFKQTHQIAKYLVIFLNIAKDPQTIL